VICLILCLKPNHIENLKHCISRYAIVIFVLSAQNDCFLLGHENEFLVETVRSRLQTHSNASTKQSSFARNTHYFFYNSILKFFNFLIFVKFSLDAKIFVKNDILCDLITMHKCHVFLTVVEKNHIPTPKCGQGKTKIDLFRDFLQKPPMSKL
jgi:hypothetical protein